MFPQVNPENILTFQKFFVVIPLYIGVEVILAVAILNKAGGAYGVLSILTGHHLNFWQWLFNLLSFLTLPFYISGLSNILNKANNVRKTSLACVIYLIDTVIGLLYTIYFVHFWFSREDNNPTSYGGSGSEASGVDAYSSYVRRDGSSDSLSQSASPQRELFLTVSGIIVTNALRLYFALVFVSFTKQLLKQSALNQKYYGADSLDEEVLHPTSLTGRVKKIIYDLEMRAKHFMTDLLN